MFERYGESLLFYTEHTKQEIGSTTSKRHVEDSRAMGGIVVIQRHAMGGAVDKTRNEYTCVRVRIILYKFFNQPLAIT